jgi:sugar phosphate isomerase/epimerase
VSNRLGVQLYTVRDQLPRDFVGVLEAVKRTGYDEVEFAGLHGWGTAAVRTVLDDIGLTAPAGHVGIDTLRDDLAGQLATAEALGYRFLVVPGVDDSERSSIDGYRRLAAELNAIGARTADAGVRLAYHNHADEFETFGGEVSGYDVLVRDTDPAIVAMELDLFWAVHAGKDPVALFEQYPGRFPLVHVKDRTASGEMTDVGAGEIDFARMFAHARLAGLEHAVVEHDEPADGLQSLRASYGPLAGLRWS